MTPKPERFKHFLILRNADGQAVHLSRAPDEAVFPALDERSGRLVELHVLPGSADLDDAEKRSVLERAALAAELRGGTFMQILEAGEDDRLIYYSSTLNDGELAEDYIARRGAMPPVAALCLTLQLLEDLVDLQSYHRLISRLKLSRLLVTVADDAHLHLRVFDFGLSEKEKRRNGNLKRLSVEVCKLIFLLVTGRPYADEDPEQVPELDCLPPRLKSTVQTVLADNTQAPETPDTLRDEVSETLAELVENFQPHNARDHLRISDGNLAPVSQLQGLVFPRVETRVPVAAMAIDEAFSDFEAADDDNPAPARRGIRGALVLSAVIVGVTCMFVWLFARDSGTASPAKQKAPVVATPTKASPPPPPEETKPQGPANENPVIVRKAIIPSTDEIAEFRRQQAAGAKDDPLPPVTKRSDLANPTARR